MINTLISFNEVAENYKYWKTKNYYYHWEIERFYKSIIPQHKNVMEIGSAAGDLLYSLEPKYGVGIDISPKMIEVASRKYPSIEFINASIENYKASVKFDYVVISNTLEYVSDLYNFFNQLRKNISFETKIVITGVNPLWEPVMRIATKLRVRTPVQQNNFVTCKDIENILNVSGYEIIESGYRISSPVNVPFISYFLNKLIPRLPVIKNICVVQYIIARLKQDAEIDCNMSCSIVIPCHNEEGNIKECIERIPKLGNQAEIIVVDDGSCDSTPDIVREIQKKRNDVRLISYAPNKGKGNAVKMGFDAAIGDIVMILDADMAVAPEELTRFYEVLASHQAEFVNGTRMVYNMAQGAMKFINYLGNKAFGIILSFIIGQRNTDTLCGTKAFYNKDYKNFKMGKCPWGDFDLLFESARLKLKTVEMPVHYYPRLQGESKMKAFKHGMMLLRMCWYGFWYLG
jgi:hypothetical protein